MTRIASKETIKAFNAAHDKLRAAGQFALAGVAPKDRASRTIPNKRTKPTKAERRLQARQAAYHADVARSNRGGSEYTKPGSLKH